MTRVEIVLAVIGGVLFIARIWYMVAGYERERDRWRAIAKRYRRLAGEYRDGRDYARRVAERASARQV